MQADRLRLEQVLSNQLSNAVKYSPQGGPIELTIHLQNEGTVVVLSVCDHGIGIPAEQQERIFGRVVRADNARESAIMGTGLGLCLSRELIERHKGRLWFQFVAGKGSTFFLRLPLASSSSPQESTDASVQMS